MSALPAIIGRISPPQWVTAGELARRTGLSGRSIQRSCKIGDLQHCHRWRDSSEGPQFLEIDLNAPTCPARYRQQQLENGELGEAHTLTDKQLKKAAKLAALFEDIERLFGGREVTHQKSKIESYLNVIRGGDKTVPSLRSYYRLKSRWLAGGRTLSALADGRALAGGGVKCAFDEDAFSFFCGLYLTQEQRLATICYHKTVEMGKVHGWTIPSLSTVLRRLDERIPKDEQILRREGDKAHQDRTKAFIIRDWSEMKTNEFWVSDHCLLDVIGIDDFPGGTFKPRRMWLTTWMDEATRFVTAWRVHRGPNKVQVMASFFMGIVSNGLPDNIRIDNGKEYRCHQFAGGRQWREELSKIEVDPEALRPLLYDLKVIPHYAQPYNAKAKIIEPWHKHTIKEHFSKFCPGYCGGSTEEKPEQLADQVKHWEKTGEGLLPWTELVRRLATVIEGYQLQGKPSLQGQCPAFLRQQKLKEISLRLANEKTAALFLEPRLITCGTFLTIDGAHYGVGDMDIIQRQGEKLCCRLHPFDAGIVYVYDLRGTFITIAKNAGRVGANTTRDNVKDAIRLNNDHDRKVRELAESSAVIASIDPAVALALQSRRGAIQPTEPLPALPAAAAYLPASFKPDFTPRADDGRRMLPASPAPEEDVDEQVTQRTDSADTAPKPRMSKDDIWGILGS